MKEVINKYIKELSAASKCRLTKHFAEEVEELSLLLSKIIQPLETYYSMKSSPDPEDAQMHAYGIMTKGANTLMAAFELTLNGYFWEPPILIRNALEGFASAWDIIHNPDRFTIWKADKKFSSTDSVSNLKKEIKTIGTMYGMLSNIYSHISQISASPSLVLLEDGPKLQFFGFVREGKEDIRKGEIYFALISAFVCLQITEVSYHQFCSDPETIEELPDIADRVKTKVSARHRKFADAALDYFKSVMDDPFSAM
jgi:hypothetical protein